MTDESAALLPLWYEALIKQNIKIEDVSKLLLVIVER